MLNYTAYSREATETEVNRYITWPGQACAYKLGEIKIRDLRRKAENELGIKPNNTKRSSPTHWAIVLWQMSLKSIQFIHSPFVYYDLELWLLIFKRNRDLLLSMVTMSTKIEDAYNRLVSIVFTKSKRDARTHTWTELQLSYKISSSTHLKLIDDWHIYASKYYAV